MTRDEAVKALVERLTKRTIPWLRTPLSNGKVGDWWEADALEALVRDLCYAQEAEPLIEDHAFLQMGSTCGTLCHHIVNPGDPHITQRSCFQARSRHAR